MQPLAGQVLVHTVSSRLSHSAAANLPCLPSLGCFRPATRPLSSRGGYPFFLFLSSSWASLSLPTPPFFFPLSRSFPLTLPSSATAMAAGLLRKWGIAQINHKNARPLPLDDVTGCGRGNYAWVCSTCANPRSCNQCTHVSSPLQPACVCIVFCILFSTLYRINLQRKATFYCHLSGWMFPSLLSLHGCVWWSGVVAKCCCVLPGLISRLLKRKKNIYIYIIHLYIFKSVDEGSQSSRSLFI